MEHVASFNCHLSSWRCGQESFSISIQGSLRDIFSFFSSILPCDLDEVSSFPCLFL